MLRTCAPIGAAIAFCLATAGCAVPPNDHAAGIVPSLPQEQEEALALNVDALDVRHGSLRIEASMLDGSADVSIWLGPTCAEHEVGRGIATRSGFAWSLSGDDIARAISCNLVVKVHGVDEDGNRVVKIAALDVGVSLVPDGADLVQLLRQETDGADTRMTFAAPSRARRLHIDGSVIGAEPEDEIGPQGLFIASFAVGNDDLARSMLQRRHISLHGEHFLATVSIGPLTLDVSEPVVEEPTPVEEGSAEQGAEED